MKMLLGKKIGMTNIFSEKGKFIPVTIVKSGANFITQIKTEEKDGYSALQIGFEETRKLKKPQEMHLKKAKAPKLRNLQEVRVTKNELKKHNIGQKLGVSVFKKGEVVLVSGISKGKGFAGVIKRHGFHRGPKTHGSDHHREPGSIGAAYPQRVFRGQKLPGRLGHEQVTVKNLKIVKVDPENDLILIKGAVPGPNKSLVVLKGEGEIFHEPETQEVHLRKVKEGEEKSEGEEKKTEIAKEEGKEQRKEQKVETASGKAETGDKQ